MIFNTTNAGKPEQTKTATPSLSQQTISPDSGKVLSGVVINPITAALLTSLDADFTAANIAENVNVFGLIGSLKSGTPVAYGRISGSGSNTLSITGLDFAPTRFYVISTGGNDTHMAGYSFVIKNGNSAAYTLAGGTLTVTPTFSSNGVTIKVSRQYVDPYWDNTYEWVVVG